MNKEICYKCQYSLKLNIISNKICKQCKNYVPTNRTHYCSESCSKEALKIKKREYWTKKVPGKVNVNNKWNFTVPEF